MAESKKLLDWRNRQKEGSIMSSETFKKIVKKKMAEGLSKKRAEKVAGKAYWNSAEAKYREAAKRMKKRRNS